MAWLVGIGFGFPSIVIGELIMASIDNGLLPNDQTLL